MADVFEEKLPTVNIIVAGITGTGKSTLINAVFGKELAKTGSGRPVTEHMNEYHNEDIPIRVWDTVGLELDSVKTKQSIQDIKTKIVERGRSKDVYGAIHAIWYCINSGSNRYQGAELNFIKELHSIGVPFFIVLTQCTGEEQIINEFENSIRKANESSGMNDIKIVQVLASAVTFRGLGTIEPYGLDTLVKATTESLPDFIQRGFVAAQQIDRELKRVECEKIIYKYVVEARKGKWRHIPLVNVIFTDNKIMGMCKELAGIYNETLAKEIAEFLSDFNIVPSQNFWGLISPIDRGYSKRVAEELEEKKADGFEVPMGEAKSNCRAARMVAFYGYIFVDAVEEKWDDIIGMKKEEIQKVGNELIADLTEKVNEAIDKN